MVKLTEKIEQTTLTKTSLKEEKIGYEEKSKVVDDVINGQFYGFILVSCKNPCVTMCVNDIKTLGNCHWLKQSHVCMTIFE